MIMLDYSLVICLKHLKGKAISRYILREIDLLIIIKYLIYVDYLNSSFFLGDHPFFISLSINTENTILTRDIEEPHEFIKLFSHYWRLRC